MKRNKCVGKWRFEAKNLTLNENHPQFHGLEIKLELMVDEEEFLELVTREFERGSNEL